MAGGAGSAAAAGAAAGAAAAGAAAGAGEVLLSYSIGDICGSRSDLYVLQKVTITLFRIL